MAHYLQTSNTDSYVRSITQFEKDWRPSQGQQEALLAEVALVVDELVADKATVGILQLAVRFTKQSLRLI